MKNRLGLNLLAASAVILSLAFAPLASAQEGEPEKPPKVLTPSAFGLVPPQEAAPPLKVPTTVVFITLAFDREKLAELGLQPADVNSAIKHLYKPGARFNLAELQNTVIAEVKGKKYLLKDVAGVDVDFDNKGALIADGEAKLIRDAKGRPGLQLTNAVVKNLGVKVAAAQAVAKPQTLSLTGTLNYDSDSLVLIKSRFSGELVSFLQRNVLDSNGQPVTDKDGKPVTRDVKYGDKVKQGDVLAVFWSVTLGTAKAAFVDAVAAVRLSHDAYQRHKRLYDEGSLPLGALRAAERQLQADNNNLLTAERTLRMWRLNGDEIEALRKEANEILDATLIAPTGTIVDINANGMTLLLSNEGKEEKAYRLAKGCKFERMVKRDVKEEIKDGPKADLFGDVAKKTLDASIATNKDGEVTEVLVGKRRNVLDEVNRWARVEVAVPWFDKAHPERELTVVEKNTNIGDIADCTNFSAWLFRLADLSRLQIRVEVPDDYRPLVRKRFEEQKGPGLPAEVRFNSSAQQKPVPVQLLLGEITWGDHHAVAVHALLDNSKGEYLVGESFAVTIPVPPPEGVVSVPAAALGESGGHKVVFVQPDPAKNEFLLRRVHVVQRFKDVAWVRAKAGQDDNPPVEPLAEGERVVTEGNVEMTAALEALLAKADNKGN